MKFVAVPGILPALGPEAIDTLLLALAVPAVMGLALSLRRDQAIFAVILAGVAAVLAG